MMKLISLFSICCFFSVVAMASSPFQERLELPQVIDSLEQLMDRHGMPGLMVSIVRGDSVLFEGGLGIKNVSTGERADGKTLFRLGSITKSFVALGVLSLVEEGKFSLDDEVKKLAPELEFENPFEDRQPVLVKHLLSHTAGFDDMHLNEIYNTTDQPDYPLGEVLKRNPNALRVRWLPGSRYAYSNPGWTIAGYLIEKFSGGPYDDYITEKILKPVGMHSSNFRSVPEGQAYARGYKSEKEEVPFLPIYHRPAGAFNSHAEDMSRFLRFMINDGAADSLQVVAKHVVALMEKPVYTLAARAGLPVGYGLGNYTFDKSLPVQFHGHDGGIDGFVSSYGYNRELQIGFALSNNAGKGMGEMVNLLKKFLTRDAEAQAPPVAPLDARAMQEYVGYYVFKASRNQLFAFVDRLVNTCEVTMENDTVYLKPFAKDRFAVVPVANPGNEGLAFRGLSDQLASHVFMKNEEGKPVMATSAVGNYLEQTSYSGVLVKRMLFAGSVALLLSALVATVVWLIFAFSKSISWVELMKRAVPGISAIAIILVFVGVISTLNDLPRAGEASLGAMLVYAGTWVTLFSALLSTRFGIMNFKTGKKLPFSIYYLLLAFSCVMMAMFLYDAGWVGLKLWRY